MLPMSEAGGSVVSASRSQAVRHVTQHGQFSESALTIESCMPSACLLLLLLLLLLFSPGGCCSPNRAVSPGAAQVGEVELTLPCDASGGCHMACVAALMQ
jgi:hypothetical protein